MTGDYVTDYSGLSRRRCHANIRISVRRFTTRCGHTPLVCIIHGDSETLYVKKRASEERVCHVTPPAQDVTLLSLPRMSYVYRVTGVMFTYGVADGVVGVIVTAQAV